MCSLLRRRSVGSSHTPSPRGGGTRDEPREGLRRRLRHLFVSLCRFTENGQKNVPESKTHVQRIVLLFSDVRCLRHGGCLSSLIIFVCPDAPCHGHVTISEARDFAGFRKWRRRRCWMLQLPRTQAFPGISAVGAQREGSTAWSLAPTAENPKKHLGTRQARARN